jgi:hypothetical protein
MTNQRITRNRSNQAIADNLTKHIHQLKQKYTFVNILKIDQNREYVDNITLFKKDGTRVFLSYEESQKRRVAENMNFHSSFCSYLYKKIDSLDENTPSMLFLTITAASEYHPFTFNRKYRNCYVKKLNPKFIEDFDWSKKVTDYYDDKMLELVKLVMNFNRTFYAEKIFKKGKLVSANRGNIFKLEHNEWWVAHTHESSLIQSKFIVEYVIKLVDVWLKYNFGRTELALSLQDFKKIESHFTLYKSNRKFDYYEESRWRKEAKPKEKYFIEGTEFYFTILDNNDIDTFMSLAGYTTKEGEENSEWAYYIADLKNKHIIENSEENNDSYLKVSSRKQTIKTYSNVLVSKEIYRACMSSSCGLIKSLIMYEDYEEFNMFETIT